MQRKQRWYSGFDRKQDAEDALPEILKQGKGGVPRKRASTVAEYLTDVWLPAIRVRVRHSTYDSYRRNCEWHLIPQIGGIRLRQLSGDDLNRMYAELLDRGGRKGEGLSPRRVRYVHAIIRKALADAVRWNIVHRNVADQADPPSQRRNRAAIRTWTAPQLRAFLDHVADDRLYALWHLLALTGMRRGEASALDWDSVDLERGSHHRQASADLRRVRREVLGDQDRPLADDRTRRAHRGGPARARGAPGSGDRGSRRRVRRRSAPHLLSRERRRAAP